jgi:hypothetical protein
MRSSPSPPFPYGFGEFGEEPAPAESKRLTPSIGLVHDSDQPTDSSNEDFLFHLYRGSELLQDNRVHEAKEELERALHLQPRDSKGQDLIAVVYFRLGLYPRAIQIYEGLRRRNANDTSLLLNLALCYLKTGQPQLARKDLEQLLSLNPNHSRAWGYLGLACERLGDFTSAERAFAHGGHQQMAKRVAAKRSSSPQLPSMSSRPMREPVANDEIRDVAGTAYSELDAGELTFSLADPTSSTDMDEQAAQSWRPHEIGQAVPDPAPVPRAAESAVDKPETQKPDTKDGPPAPDAPAVQPQLGRAVQGAPPAAAGAAPFNRRPTLIAPVGAAPPYEFLAKELAALENMPSQKPPSFGLDDASMPPTPSLRRPVVSVPNPFAPPTRHDPLPVLDDPGRTRTLAPPLGAHGSAPPQGPGSKPPEELHIPSAPPAGEESWDQADDPITAMPPANIVMQIESAANAPVTPPGLGPPLVDAAPREQTISLKPETARTPSQPAPTMSFQPRHTATVAFPVLGGVVLHPSGLALARTTAEVGFVARLEAFRAQQSGLKMSLLERHVKGKPNGESFGGVASPMVIVAGEGELVLGARPGRKLHAFPIDEMCFVREDVLLGFGGGTGVAFENGRLSTGESEHLPIVQLRGDGAVLIEAIGDVVGLAVHSERSLSVRREAILGWFGRLVPRAITPADAPCAQRGLVSFAGEGRVLLAGT